MDQIAHASDAVAAGSATASAMAAAASSMTHNHLSRSLDDSSSSSSRALDGRIAKAGEGFSRLPMANGNIFSIEDGMKAVQMVVDAMVLAFKDTTSVDKSASKWIDGHVDPRSVQDAALAVTDNLYHHAYQQQQNGVVARILAGDLVDSQAPVCLFYGAGTPVVQWAGNLLHTLATCGVSPFAHQIRLRVEGVPAYSKNDLPLEHYTSRLKAVEKHLNDAAYAVNYAAAGAAAVAAAQAGVALATTPLVMAVVRTGMFALQISMPFGLSVPVYQAAAVSAIAANAWILEKGVAPVRMLFRDTLGEGYNEAHILELQNWLNTYTNMAPDVQDEVDSALQRETSDYLRNMDIHTVQVFDTLMGGALVKLQNETHLANNAAASAGGGDPTIYLRAPGLPGFSPFVYSAGKLVVNPRDTARSLELLQRLTLSQYASKSSMDAFKDIALDARLKAAAAQSPELIRMNMASGTDAQRVSPLKLINTIAVSISSLCDAGVRVMHIVNASFNEAVNDPSEGRLLANMSITARSVCAVLAECKWEVSIIVATLAALVCYKTGITSCIGRRLCCANNRARARLAAASGDSSRRIQALEQKLLDMQALHVPIQDPRMSRVRRSILLHRATREVNQSVINPILSEERAQARMFMRLNPNSSSPPLSQPERAEMNAANKRDPMLIRRASEAVADDLALDSGFQQAVGTIGWSLDHMRLKEPADPSYRAAFAAMHGCVLRMLQGSQTQHMANFELHNKQMKDEYDAEEEDARADAQLLQHVKEEPVHRSELAIKQEELVGSLLVERQRDLADMRVGDVQPTWKEVEVAPVKYDTMPSRFSRQTLYSFAAKLPIVGKWFGVSTKPPRPLPAPISRARADALQALVGLA